MKVRNSNFILNNRMLFSIEKVIINVSHYQKEDEYSVTDFQLESTLISPQTGNPITLLSTALFGCFSLQDLTISSSN